MGRRCFIGHSERSNINGINQLRHILEPLDYLCTTIPVAAGLHLKSSVNAVADDTIVVTPDFANLEAFRSLRQVLVPEGEAYAANVLRANERLLVPEGYPRTLAQLQNLGLGVEIVALDLSEARRMDGGLTCLSLRF
jgi:dimethylargininase